MSEKTDSETKRNPNIWVPSLYYTQGFPYSFVTEMSQVFFKAMNVPIEALGIISGVFNLPWAFKFLWSPLVDLFGTKRRWILIMQLCLAAMFLAVAVISFFPISGNVISFNIFMPNTQNAWVPISVLLFLFVLAFGLDYRRPGAAHGILLMLVVVNIAVALFYHPEPGPSKLLQSLYQINPMNLDLIILIIAGCLLLTAFFSATHDIAIDGYYLDLLDKDAQATYSGIRVAAYRVAMVVASGLLVVLAGWTNWAIAFLIGALLFLGFLLFHSSYLPAQPAHTRPTAGSGKSFVDAFTTYLDQKRIVFILLFIVLFRLGDFLWKPMSKPFLMDIGVSIEQIGLLQGIIGIIATILGSIAGGIYIARKGLTRGLWVLGIIQSVTLLLYAYLALVHPVVPKGQAIPLIGLIHVGLINTFENFAYGLGTIAFVNFLMRTCKKEYTAAHYAIATGLMALAMAVASIYSGFITKNIGYMSFFIVCFAFSIPGLIVLLFLPVKEMETAKE